MIIPLFSKLTEKTIFFFDQYKWTLPDIFILFEIFDKFLQHQRFSTRDLIISAKLGGGDIEYFAFRPNPLVIEENLRQ